MIKDELAIAIQARDLLEGEGAWCQGALKKIQFDHEGAPRTGYCSMGALYQAGITYGNDVLCALDRRLNTLIQEKTNLRTIGYFNDSDETSHEDVLVMFDLLIDRLQSALMAEEAAQ